MERLSLFMNHLPFTKEFLVKHLRMKNIFNINITHLLKKVIFYLCSILTILEMSREQLCLKVRPL